MAWNDLILHSDRLHIIKISKLALAKIPQAARALASTRYHLKIYICWSQDSDRIRIFMLIVMWVFGRAPLAELRVVCFLNSLLCKVNSAWLSWRLLSYNKIFWDHKVWILDFINHRRGWLHGQFFGHFQKYEWSVFYLKKGVRWLEMIWY